MSQTSLLKSAAITNLDTIPILAPTQGEGGPSYLQEIDGYVTCLTADTTSSVYRIVRLPTNVKVKSVVIDTAALSASTTLNVGAYYSDAYSAGGVFDGTPPSLSGTVISAAFFASALAATSANVRVDVTNQAGNYPISNRNEYLWQALGLSADPGGFIDITVVPNVAIVAGGVIGLTVEYAR